MLESIYREALRRCAPDVLVRHVVRPDMPRHVVAIGKSAGPLLEGVASLLDIESSFAVVPRDYPAPEGAWRGSHPEMDPSSFIAGDALIRYVDSHDDVLFLISGGGSACVDAPLAGWFTREELIAVNARLIASGLSIAEINTVRKHLSAIKGGRLAARVKGRSVTLLYSDVATGDLNAIASGPTVPDSTTNAGAASILERLGGFDRIVRTLRDESLPETPQIGNASAWLIADNHTLTRAAADVAREHGLAPLLLEDQIEDDVETAAVTLTKRARALQNGELLIAGGEPTVIKHGRGKGGRCSELALRFALHYDGDTASALFGSSDGIDGNSGVAGVVLDRLPAPIDARSAAAALAQSDSFRMVVEAGRPIIIPPGNNLRDLYLVARG
jgi:glycerate 2-kinase